VLGHRPVRTLSRAEVRRWWDGLRDPARPGGPLSARNANAQLALFRNIVRWADGTDEFGPLLDPSRGIQRWAEDSLSEKTDFFEPEEVMAVCRAADELHREMRLDPDRRERAYASRHDAAIFLVAAFTRKRHPRWASLRACTVLVATPNRREAIAGGNSERLQLMAPATASKRKAGAAQKSHRRRARGVASYRARPRTADPRCLSLERAFDPVPWPRHAQRREDRARSWRAIECDEVDAGRAAFEQFDALQGRVGDAELRYSLVVIESDRQLHLEPRRQLGRR
jgi:hypothetical protein